MLQASTKAQRRRSRTPTSIQRVLNIDYSYITNIEAPIIGKVDHRSIEFTWQDLNETDITGDNRLKYELQEEEDEKDKFKTVYIGYADNYIVEGLNPLREYRYRLIVSAPNDQQLATSVCVSATTSKEPFKSKELFRAVQKKNKYDIKEIVESGDVNIDTQDKFGQTPLMIAAQKGYTDIVEQLLELGADINQRDTSGKNCLMLSCFAGQKEVIELLIRLTDTQITDTDKNGCNSLHYAVDSNNHELVEWVVKQQDGLIELRDTVSGWTALLRVCATSANTKVIQVLLKCGANVNAQDLSGKTPLMLTCINGHYKSTKMLLDNGADIYLKTQYGKTCVEIAASFDRQDIKDLLEEEVERLREKEKEDKKKDAEQKNKE